MQREKPSPENGSLAFQRAYQLGPKFVKTYLDYWNKNNPEHPLHAPADVEKIPAERRDWAEYALTANQRGQEFVSWLTPHLGTMSGRALVLNLEFCGVLTALNRAGLDAWGVIIDQQYGAFARANAADSGIADHIVKAAPGAPLPAALGSFDKMLAGTAIELSPDPNAQLAEWINRLNPGGVLELEIPNKYSLDFVAKDRRFGLFAFMLLAREDALAYHQACRGGQAASGAYRVLAQYQLAAEQAGCTTELVANPLSREYDLNDCGPLADAAMEAYQRFLKNEQARLPQPIRIKLDVLFRKYMAGLVQDLAEVIQGAYELAAFRRKYLSNFWNLIIRKPS